MTKKKKLSILKIFRIKNKGLRYTIYGAGALLFLFAISITIAVAIIYKNLPKPEELFNQRVSQSTKLYDREGKALLYEIHGEEKRTIIPFNEIPDAVKKATISIEDQGFYKHPAFDWKAIIRSIIKNIIYLRIEQGGSTITQQLAKNAYLTPEKTITRKIKELFLAMRLEGQFTKDEVLNLYLNQVPYGSNAYGIEAAAKTFFNKKAKDLNIAESALLAALPNAPTYYSPYGIHKENLLARKNTVLKEMKKLGYINEQEFTVAEKYKFSFSPQTTYMKAPHFVVAVQDYLEKKYGYDTVEKGGLSVITTLDLHLQEAAEEIMTRNVKRNITLYGGKNGALFAEDPKNGEVLAMVGSANYFDIENEGNFNVATQGLRQPGSSFKPFAYYTAFLKGYSPNTVLFDLPTEFDTTKIKENSYKPVNYGNIYRGPISLRNALASSVNIPAVKIMYLVGIDDVLKTARQFGITTLNDRTRYGLSLVLGGGEVRLSEMTHAYSVFANDGLQSTQTMVLEVKNDKGVVLESYKNDVSKVAEPQYVRMLNDVLSDVEARKGLLGSAVGITVFSGHEVALKTGTTNDFVDAWAMGYTPGIVIGIWIGNNHREPLQNSGGSIATAIPIWSEMMKKALENKEPEPFLKPEPYIANKPILNGDYLNQKQIHSILYYVDKHNPLGPSPLNPEADSQFWNWELPVLGWAKQNLADYGNYNKGVYLVGENSKVQITINSPENGAFVSNQFNLSFTIAPTTENIERVEILWNDVSLEQSSFNLISLPYQKSISVPSLETQNKLSVKVTNNKGEAYQKDTILFSQSSL